jgi:hypothetical protein
VFYSVIETRDFSLFNQSAQALLKGYFINSYINTRGNWENSKLCENTPPFERRVSTQFLVFPISTRVDITVYQHGKCFIFVKYKLKLPCCHGNTDVNASLRSVLINYYYFMLNQCLENIGEGLLHACISTNFLVLNLLL